MTDYTWTGASNTSWANGANWSGGTGSDFPDDNGDKAIFNSGSANCTMNVFSLTVGEISITSGYSGTINQTGAVTVDNAGAHNGNLTIEGGTWNTLGSSTSHALTVKGGIKNTGTLTANASTIIITGEIAGFAFDQMGTFNAGTSTIQIGDGSTSTVGSSTHFKTNNCHNLIINQHIDAPNGNVAWRAYTGTEVTIGGNLTITRGRFYRNTSTQDLTVTGDVDIASVGKLGTEAASGSNTFRSLTINSGGTYQATSGTTNITGETGGFAIDNDGTFTHNNGKVNITTANTVIAFSGTGNLYDLEINGLVQVPSGTHTIDNNVTVASGHTFSTNNLSTNLTVHGIVNASGTFWRTDNTGTVTLGGLTINSGGLYRATNATTIIKGALRNLGGTIT